METISCIFWSLEEKGKDLIDRVGFFPKSWPWFIVSYTKQNK